MCSLPAGALLGGVRAHAMEGLLEASQEWTRDAQVATVPFLVTFAARLQQMGGGEGGQGGSWRVFPVTGLSSLTAGA